MMCDAGRIPVLSPQGQVLQAWRDSLRSGGGSVIFNSWGMGDPCVMRWGGVECENGTIVGIRLQPPNNNGIAGTYTQGPIQWEALTNLTSLRVLELQVCILLPCYHTYMVNY